ncbi:MAG: hypothetical protein IJ752_08215 [Alphaproteobacteria bacterium]|nr:hypothetical protein [Alphaproteobacteria bacterium]
MKKELYFAVRKCAQNAFDLDEEIRKERNKRIDMDKTKQPNLELNCAMK